MLRGTFTDLYERIIRIYTYLRNHARVYRWPVPSVDYRFPHAREES